MKKLVLILTLICICAFAAPAFANPFSDVPADHWSYDAINKLASDGIVAGNPNGTYTGNKNMTRYEMATIVARAMAATEADDAKVSAENKAMIDKLAAEFGTELDALGVRVSALEDKVGNVKFSGVARLRYKNADYDDEGNNNDHYQFRIRLKAEAQVNENVKVVGRFTTDNVDLADDSGTDADATFDHYYVQYADKNLTAIVGRADAYLGKGTLIDDYLTGAQLIVPFGKDKDFTFAAISGRLEDDDVFGGDEGGAPNLVNNMNLTAFELNGKIGGFGLGFDYGILESKDDQAFNGFDDKADLWAINADYAFNDKWSVFAEYVKSDIEFNKFRQDTSTTIANDGTASDDAYFIGVDYKAHPRLALNLTYGKVGSAAIIPGISTWSDGLDNAYANLGMLDGEWNDDYDMWKFQVNYDLMKNIDLYAAYWMMSGDVVTTDLAGNGNIDDKDVNYFETGMNFKF